MNVRKEVFAKDYLEPKYGEFHKSFFGSEAEVPGLGYPDMGSGPFS